MEEHVVLRQFSPTEREPAATRHQNRAISCEVGALWGPLVPLVERFRSFWSTTTKRPAIMKEAADVVAAEATETTELRCFWERLKSVWGPVSLATRRFGPSASAPAPAE